MSAVTSTPSGPMVACSVEDGSLPGQTFPCLWNASEFGNGTGHSFVLDGVDTAPQYVFEIDADGTVFTQPTPPEFVTLCHDGDTITVEAWVSIEHVTLGDALGECDPALWHPVITPESADVQEQQAIDAAVQANAVADAQAEVSVPVTSTPSGLAETGMDMHGVLLATALVVVGVVVKRLAKRGAM